MNNARMDDLTDYLSLSLAGAVLSAELVHNCAHGRQQEPDALAAVKGAITSHHAASLREVFPRISDYRQGVASAISALEGKPANPEALRYTLQLIEIAALLKRSPETADKLGRALDGLPEEPDDSALARVYQATISTLGKRIQVTGNPKLLQQDETAEEIRALLLGGVRFAWLWQQLGGRRWHLIVKRKHILRSLKALNTILQSTVH